MPRKNKYHQYKKPRYDVGDKVFVKGCIEDIDKKVIVDIGFTFEMKNFLGKEVTIGEVCLVGNDLYYKIVEDNGMWVWVDDFFEIDIDSREIFGKSHDEIKAFLS